MKQIIHTSKAPEPIGPYSQAVLVNETLYVSGQIPVDPATNLIVSDSIEAEAEQVMKNISAILTEAGFDFDNVVKSTIFLSSMEHFAQVNTIYGAYFSGVFPARETVAMAGLPKGVNVEVSVIACKD